MMMVAAVWSMVVCLVGLLADCFAKPRIRYASYDALFVSRCEAQCWNENHRSSCIKNCLTKGVLKPGRCPPVINFTLSPFDSACLNTCQIDSHCPGLTKCCKHSCGITCQSPEDLLSTEGIPDIPTDLKITEGRRKKTIYITWNPGDVTYFDEGGGTVVYLIEERHHAGRNFVEKRLTEWIPCARTIKFSNILKQFVKPGRWYQFRVAAVNSNGTKGYSENSLPISISMNPKPPRAPENVTVGPLWYKNGSLSAELRWTPPSSDLPLEKYKVFWSRRLHGAKALDSVLVHQQVVPKEQNYFMLQDIQPNALYFLQVQALSQFGNERLKGDKSGLVLNTTNYTNVTDNSVYSTLKARIIRIQGLRLQRLYWSHGDLRAKITWKSKRDTSRYFVTWWVGPCQADRNGISHNKLTATTKATHFDLYDLQFNCRYRVSVKSHYSPQELRSIRDTSVTFSTPSCQSFKIGHKRIKCINR